MATTKKTTTEVKMKECPVCQSKFNPRGYASHLKSCKAKKSGELAPTPEPKKKVSSFKAKRSQKKQKLRSKIIRFSVGIAALLLIGLFGWFVLGNLNTKTETATQPEKVAEVVEVAKVYETTKAQKVDPLRVSNKLLDPAWAAYERSDRPVITEWKKVYMTLSQNGKPIEVVVYFPYVISENDVDAWKRGDVVAKSYVGKNPVLTNAIVHSDTEGVQGEWNNFEVAKKGPNGLSPRPGLPRFGNEEFTSTHKWVKIQEI